MSVANRREGAHGARGAEEVAVAGPRADPGFRSRRKGVSAPTEYEYGARECTLEDLAGHRWQFTETVRDVAPEEWGGVTVAPSIAPPPA